MALYHLSVKTVSRASGRSAVAAAAYRSGDVLTNERDGMTHDYTARGGVEETFIVAPEGAAWAQDRAVLWNAAEAAENRKNSVVAREWEVALPDELSVEARRELAAGFAGELVERYGVVADVAIHGPHAMGDARNHHAHILTTTREAGSDGLGAKTRSLDVSTSGEIEAMRERWAERVNDRARTGAGRRAGRSSQLCAAGVGDRADRACRVSMPRGWSDGRSGTPSRRGRCTNR